MIAALPMYDWPELRAETDRLWQALRDALGRSGIDAPETLTRDRQEADIWCDSDLLFAQTCGYPYATALRGTVRLVATPVYCFEGCAGPTYRSAIVVRLDDTAESLAELRGRRAAYNAADSQSGYSAFRAAIAPLAEGAPFFAGTLKTGGHLASMTAVATGAADCAAIDCVCLGLARRVRPDPAGRLRILAWSDPAPALPFVTAAGRSDREVELLRAGLNTVLADPLLSETRAVLGLRGIEILPDDAYDAIVAMERAAIEAGYPDLR